MKYWIAAFCISCLARTALAQIPSDKIIVSYNGLTPYGRNNRDSVLQSLENLGVPVDSVLDRNAVGNDTIDYSPFSILVWACGDPAVGTVPDSGSGQAAPNPKEIGEIENYLSAGEPDCKRTFVIAGQNLAHQLGSVMPHGSLDTQFLLSSLHVRYVANSSATGIFRGTLIGNQPSYWRFTDSLVSTSPDVIAPAMETPPVGPVVNQLAYSYFPHSLTPFDSGAGVSYCNPSLNIIFYGFDWADPIVTRPVGHADTTSGVTRVMAGAFAFIASHQSFCTASVPQAAQLPSFVLHSIVPNPARTAITVSFSLSSKGNISITIRDVLGKKIKTVTFQHGFEAGTWSQTIVLPELPEGIYLCEISAENSMGTGRTMSREFMVQ